MRERPPTFRVNRHHPLASGLVFAGLGGGASSLLYADASGYGNHGTLTGSEGAWRYDSNLCRWGYGPLNATNSITISASPTLNAAGNGPLTVSLWLGQVSNQGSGRFLLGTSAVSGRWYISTPTSDTLYFNKDWSSGDITATVSYTLSSDQASHLAITWNGGSNATGSDVVIYRNGTSLTPSATTAGGTPYNSTTDLVNGLSSLTWTCYEELIYNRALSPAEIQQLADPSNVMLSGLILPPRRRLWAVSGTPTIEGTVCWGHDTDVEETYKYAFSGNWTGTGAASGTGDAEVLTLDDGEYMESTAVVHTGTNTVTIQADKYATGDGGSTLKYRHAATAAGAKTGDWTTYSAPFASDGYVQVRVEN